MSPSNSLNREEYIEQEYFFRTYRERLESNVPSQEILKTIQEELLATCQLPVAVDILRTEMLHSGQIGLAMERLPHYFTKFQTFVVRRAEDDRARFEQLTALKILEREAGYRAADVSPAGLFMFQFECLARNRLGYHDGLTAMAQDATYNSSWKEWIRDLIVQQGTRELAELVYRASAHYRQRRSSQAGGDATPDCSATLFGDQDGRIARASIGRDPVHFFSALQRQLNYPRVPLPQKPDPEKLSPILDGRLSRIEQRLKMLEMEQRGGIDLTRFYGQHREIEDIPDK